MALKLDYSLTDKTPDFGISLFKNLTKLTSCFFSGLKIKETKNQNNNPFFKALLSKLWLQHPLQIPLFALWIFLFFPFKCCANVVLHCSLKVSPLLPRMNERTSEGMNALFWERWASQLLNPEMFRMRVCA